MQAGSIFVVPACRNFDLRPHHFSLQWPTLAAFRQSCLTEELSGLCELRTAETKAKTMANPGSSISGNSTFGRDVG